MSLALGHLTYVDCKATDFDMGLASALAALPDAAMVEVTCSAANSVWIHGTFPSQPALDERVALPPGSPTLRARVLGFVLSERARGRTLPGRRALGKPRTLPPAAVNEVAPLVAIPPIVLPSVDVSNAASLFAHNPAPLSDAPRIRPSIDTDSVERLNPIELAIIPQLGLNQAVGWPARNNLALGLIVVSSTWLDGLSIAPFSSVQRGGRGLQIAALAAEVNGSWHGMQASALIAVSRSQATGLQLAATTVAKDFTGLQLGIINVADEVSGAQVGILNFANTVRGTQLGFFNSAKHSRFSVGAINAIRDTPLRFAIEASSSAAIRAILKMGGGRLYAKLTAGWSPLKTLRLGWGLGFHQTLGNWFYVEPEVEAQSVWDLREPSTFARQGAFMARTNLGYQWAPQLAIYVGAGLEVLLIPPTARPQEYALFIFQVASGVGVGIDLAAGVQF